MIRVAISRCTKDQRKKIIRDARKVHAVAFVDDIRGDLVIAGIPYEQAKSIVIRVTGGSQ